MGNRTTMGGQFAAKAAMRTRVGFYALWKGEGVYSRRMGEEKIEAAGCKVGWGSWLDL